MSDILSVDGLSKFYAYGQKKAVSGLSFKLEKGQILGLLGPNGSGKTTTLGMLLGVIRPSMGHFQWFGETASEQHRRMIGSLLERPRFYPWLSGTNNLKIVAATKGVPDPKQNIAEVLERVGLSKSAGEAYSAYSLGMQQRLAVASALMGRPKVLVLDEPTNGVDAKGIADIRGIISEFAEQGGSVILASHILDEVEKVCTHAAFMKEGSLLSCGPIEKLLAKHDLIEVAAKDQGALAKALDEFKTKHPKMGAYKQLGLTFCFELPADIALDELNQFLFSAGVVASHLRRRSQSLEQHFLQLVE